MSLDPKTLAKDVVVKLKSQKFFRRIQSEQAQKIVERVVRTTTELVIRQALGEDVEKDWKYTLGTLKSLKAVSETDVKDHISSILKDAVPEEFDTIKEILWA